MNKILTIPSDFKTLGDGVIIGIKGLSTNMPRYYDVGDIAKFDKEVFISLNKNMLNSDIPLLEEVLLNLNEYNVAGILFYDSAVVNLVKKHKLSYNLVWAAEHLTTNHDTVNFWLEQGVLSSYISSDITLREMLEIKENTSSKLMVNVFGYIPIFTSKRHLVNNYLETFNLKNDSKINLLKKEDVIYPIVDEEETTVYSDFIIEGLKETLLLNYDYIVLNSFNIEEYKFLKVVNIYKDLNSDNVLEMEIKLNDMFPNLKKGFFYKETVYKVK